MNRPPHLSNQLKRATANQYLTPRERPIITYQQHSIQTSPKQPYRSRERQRNMFNISNASISFKEEDTLKLRQSNPMTQLKLKLTTLKQEVNNAMNNESRSRQRNVCSYKNQMISYRSSSVEQFNPTLSINTSAKKLGIQTPNNDSAKILVYQNQNLKRQNQVLKNKYSIQKLQAEKQILDLSRKLISTSQKLSTTQSCFQEYKRQIQSEMDEIRRSMQLRNSFELVYHQHQNWKKTMQQNSILKQKIQQLNIAQEHNNQMIQSLQQKIMQIQSYNELLRSNKNFQLSKLSQIKVQSNIFDLSKSKINIQQQQQNLTHNLNQLQEYLKSNKQQQRMLKQKLVLLQDLLMKQRSQKHNIQKQIQKSRCQIISKQKQIDLLSYSLSLTNKNNQQLLRLNIKLQNQISQLRARESPKQSIIQLIESEISIKQSINYPTEESRIMKCQEYQSYILKLEQQIQTLKHTIDIMTNTINNNKQLILQNNSDVDRRKDEQIENLSTKISLINVQLKNTKTQLEIQRLKNTSDKKQITIGYQINIQSLRSQVQLCKKNNESLSERLRIAIQDGKRKDQFIQKWIICKAKGQEEINSVDIFFEKYRRQFDDKYQFKASELEFESKETDIVC